MLVVSRRKNELIDIGNEIEVVVVEIQHNVVRLGINAPPHIRVNRREVTEAIKRHEEEKDSECGHA